MMAAIGGQLVSWGADGLVPAVVQDAADGRVLMVAHVERGDRIRIISARTLNRTERRDYEETQR